MSEWNLRIRTGFFAGLAPVPLAAIECAAEHRKTGRLAILDCRAKGYPNHTLIVHDPAQSTLATVAQMCGVLQTFAHRLTVDFPDVTHLVFINFRAGKPKATPPVINWAIGSYAEAQFHFCELVRECIEAKAGEHQCEWISLSDETTLPRKSGAELHAEHYGLPLGVLVTDPAAKRMTHSR